jgi:hypothetical protein
LVVAVSCVFWDVTGESYSRQPPAANTATNTTVSLTYRLKANNCLAASSQLRSGGVRYRCHLVTDERVGHSIFLGPVNHLKCTDGSVHCWRHLSSWLPGARYPSMHHRFEHARVLLARYPSRATAAPIAG